MDQKTIVVIGGGAAGFFAAINAAQKNATAKVLLLEKSTKLLSKVKVSGGGRCNVTHACFDIQQLVKSYPRGQKQLFQAFHQFNTTHTINWFESRGVALKAEGDGRMFPQSNSSQSIVDCLMQEAEKYHVQLKLQANVKAIQKRENGFLIQMENGGEFSCNKLIIANGGSAKQIDYDYLTKLGHSIEAPVPSLFTFNIPNTPISKLMGLSVQHAKVSISGTKLSQEGALLITHWGFSGPAVLKLSAWGARKLFERNYTFEIRINWLAQFNFETIQKEFTNFKNERAAKQVSTCPWNEIPKRLWEYFLAKADIVENLKWGDVSKKQFNKLAEIICNDTYQAKGKTTFKEEFVTCGGVKLDEVDFKTMESKVCKNLFFAGEVLDIDGITGGFNFQAAWTTAWIASQNV
ncbi:MAG: NAD(P)/FAD-dependent oxidoreductase [Bacteroidetes bacterium]|nr:NAD(P)/FAD-dependent oxidoreductase [Bacteroidota bacterium]